MNKFITYFSLVFLITSFKTFAQQQVQDTAKRKKLADNRIPSTLVGPRIIEKSKDATTISMDKKMENSFKGVDANRVVKKKSPVINKNLAKSAQDPNALSLGNFKVSENLYGEHAKYIYDYVDKYHKNHGPRMTRIKTRNKGYFSMIDKTLKKNGIPIEFHSLAVIESALNPNATSPVGAVGPWQFMAPTAMMFGLKVTDSIDERTDFIKSTWAAAKYCKRLNGIFHDWLLVVASYNCGPAPVLRAMKKTGGKSFWDLKQHLPKETQNHVMAFIATSVWFDKNSKVLDFGGVPKNSKPADYEGNAKNDKKNNEKTNPRSHLKSSVNSIDKSTKGKEITLKENKTVLTKNEVSPNQIEEDIEIVEASKEIKHNANMPLFLNDEIQNVITLKIRGDYNLQTLAEILVVDLDALCRWNPKFNEKAIAGKEQLFLTIPTNKLDAFLLQKEKILSISHRNPYTITPVISAKKNIPSKPSTPEVSDIKTMDVKKVVIPTLLNTPKSNK